jgi:hypothetical protein
VGTSADQSLHPRRQVGPEAAALHASSQAPNLQRRGEMVTPQLGIAVFLIAQLCDGVFTYLAIQHFGVLAEGNPLLATWVVLVGPQPAIIGAKLLASGCGVLLYAAHRYDVLGGLTLLYGTAAVGPWLVAFRQL